MRLGARFTTGWRATISVAMSNYIEAGSIIAIATSLAFWQAAFGISNFAFAVNFTMLLAGFVITGIAVGAGVPAPWYRRTAASVERAKHVGTAQLAWSIAPLIGFALAAALTPLGLLGSRLIFLHLFVVAAVVWWLHAGQAGIFMSRIAGWIVLVATPAPATRTVA